MLLYTFMMLTPGVMLWGLYEGLVYYWPDIALGLGAKRSDIATLVAGFAFSMLGFLATIITVLFAFTHSSTFARYQKRGYLQVFFYIYFLTIICLVLTSILAIANFSNTFYLLSFRLMMIGFMNSLVQIATLTIILCNIARHAVSEK